MQVINNGCVIALESHSDLVLCHCSLSSLLVLLNTVLRRAISFTLRRAYQTRPNKISSLRPAAQGHEPKKRRIPLMRVNYSFARLNIGHTPRKFPTSMGSHLPLHRISSSLIIIHYKFNNCNSFSKKVQPYEENISRTFLHNFV